MYHSVYVNSSIMSMSTPGLSKPKTKPAKKSGDDDYHEVPVHGLMLQLKLRGNISLKERMNLLGGIESVGCSLL